MILHGLACPTAARAERALPGPPRAQGRRLSRGAGVFGSAAAAAVVAPAATAVVAPAAVVAAAATAAGVAAPTAAAAAAQDDDDQDDPQAAAAAPAIVTTTHKTFTSHKIEESGAFRSLSFTTHTMSAPGGWFPGDKDISNCFRKSDWSCRNVRVRREKARSPGGLRRPSGRRFPRGRVSGRPAAPEEAPSPPPHGGAGRAAVRGAGYRRVRPPGRPGLGLGGGRAGPQQGGARRRHHPAGGHLHLYRGDGRGGQSLQGLQCRHGVCGRRAF